jgi:hypothetical protein
VTANAILSGFQSVLEANTIRVGINEPTVSGTWWTTGYKAIIDAATSQNFKVILGYWAHQNGKPDDVTAFNTMWQTVITTYNDNPLAARGFSPDEQQTRLGASAAHRMT